MRHARSTLTAILAVLFAACVNGCAASAPPQSSSDGALATRAAAEGSALPPDPARESGVRWKAPVPVARGVGRLAWAGSSAPAPCRAAVNTGPVIRVDNEADFEALFCRRSDIDWRRLQLFLYRLAPMAGRALLTEDVVLNDSQINWLLVPAPCPDSGGSAAQPAILIARSDLPVVARLKPSVPFDCPAVGYGY